MQISTTQMQAEDGEQGVRLNVIVDPRMRVSEVEVKRRRPDGGLDDNLSVKREELMRVHPKPWETKDDHEAAGGAVANVRNQTVTKPGEILRETRLHRDALAMEDFYRDNGYKDVKITYKEVDAKGRRQKLFLKLRRAIEVLSGKIRFLGNKKWGQGS